MNLKRIHILFGILLLMVCAFPFRAVIQRPLATAVQILRGKKTVSDRVKEYGPAVHQRLATDFAKIGVSYPPGLVTLVGIKQDNLLEVWVSDPPQLLKTYAVHGASGVLGPKLRGGDMQVPEGLYRIESLNPNSMFHLALRLNYPNSFDKAKGRIDGRNDLGGAIMIHGKSASIGCLAMGNQAAEDLFVLAADTGIDHVSVILTPVDFRKQDLPQQMPDVPDWTPELYASIKQELLKLAIPSR